MEKFLKDQDIEVYAMKILHNSYNTCILSIYKASPGNFTYLVKKLETIINSLHIINTKYITCGDMNINYLVKNNRKKILDALFTSYNYLALFTFLLGFRTIQ
jgi:hypothetical protein